MPDIRLPIERAMPDQSGVARTFYPALWDEVIDRTMLLASRFGWKPETIRFALALYSVLLEERKGC